MRSKFLRFVPAAAGVAKTCAAATVAMLFTAMAAHAAPEAGGEANLKLPDLSSVSFIGGVNGHNLLLYGILASVFGLVFGMVSFMKLKNLPVHRAMREISELIYETCKTYLITQGKFLMLLEAFIAVVIVLYFGALLHMEAMRVIIILAFSVVGIGVSPRKQGRMFFLERKNQRTFTHGTRGARSTSGPSHKSLFASFSTEKEVLPSHRPPLRHRIQELLAPT